MTSEEEMQAYTDALGAIVVAIGFQIDPVRLFADLQALANQAERAGHGPSAGLIDRLVDTLRQHHLAQAPKH